MSRFHGNDRRCPSCGITYGKFRTGYSYRAIYELMMDYSDDPKDWRYKRRHTVLGYWHQIKKEMWEQHKEECAAQACFARAQRRRQQRGTQTQRATAGR